jgi:predicted aspartyl protease
MIFPFDPRGGLILVPARLIGPTKQAIALLALDTGATSSMISWEIAELLGYDPATVVEQAQMTTVSMEENAPQIIVDKIEVLEKERDNFRVLCHTLPPGADPDGILGLDFLRGYRLTLDFRVGLLTLD